MHVWTERRWWHHLPNILSFMLLTGGATGVILTILATPPLGGWAEAIRFVLDLSAMVLGSAGLSKSGSCRSSRYYRAEKGTALVLTWRMTSEVVQAMGMINLERIYLRPWPWRTSYSAQSYPTNLEFSHHFCRGGALLALKVTAELNPTLKPIDLIGNKISSTLNYRFRRVVANVIETAQISRPDDPREYCAWFVEAFKKELPFISLRDVRVENS